MTRSSWVLEPSEQHPWAFADGVFSDDECDAIIGMMADYGDATIVSGLDRKYRDSQVAWLWPDTDTAFIFQRLTAVVAELNSNYFRFDLTSFDEGLQLTKYPEGGKYEWHCDSGYGNRVRKLSVTVQLSDPSTYRGGDLELREGKKPLKMERKRGKVVVFPSWTLHRVTPVTEGTRYSLVAWITGPAFR